MKPILSNRTFTVDEKVKPEDLFVKELADYFGKPYSGKGSMFGVVRKFGEQKCKTAYLEMEKAGDRKFNNLMQKLHHS